MIVNKSNSNFKVLKHRRICRRDVLHAQIPLRWSHSIELDLHYLTWAKEASKGTSQKEYFRSRAL